MLLLLLQESRILRMFVNSADDSGWEDTALNWLIAAFVIAGVCAGVMLIIKWLKKRGARNILQKTWGANKTVVLILLGLLPVFLTLLIVWYMTRNFFNYISVGGLLKGIVFSWLLYVVLMFAGHLLSPQWRRDLF
jgi:hypothetical protein